MVLFVIPIIQSILGGTFGQNAKLVAYVLAIALAITSTVFMAKDTKSVPECKTDKLVAGITAALAVVIYMVAGLF